MIEYIALKPTLYSLSPNNQIRQRVNKFASTECNLMGVRTVENTRVVVLDHNKYICICIYMYKYIFVGCVLN